MFRRGQLPSITTYSDAKELYEKVIPIRGRSVDVRPFGVRRKDEAQIDKGQILGVDVYKGMLYGSQVITYFPDDSMVINACGYPTQTTSSFVTEVLRNNRTYMRHGRGMAVIGQRLGDSTATSRVQEYVVPSDGLRISFEYKTDGDNTTPRLVVHNPVKATQHIANRKAINEKSKKYKTFREYLKTLCKMVPSIEYDMRVPAQSEEYKALLNFETEQRYALNPHYGRERHRQVFDSEAAKEILDLVEGDADPENMYAVAKKLIALSCASESKWDQSANQFSCIKFFPSEKADKQFIEFLKQAYAEEVFDEVEVPMGEVKRNNNAKYF